MDPLVVLTVSVFLAFLLASAAVHKIVAPASFRDAIAAYDLVPAGLVPVLGYLLPVVELIAAALIVVDNTRVIGGLLAAALFALYGTAIAVNLMRGRRDIDCGCSWGTPMGRQSGHLHGGHVLRNLALTILALGLAVGLSGRSVGWLDYFNAIMGGLTLGLIWIAIDHLVANRRILREGRLS